MPDAPAPQSPPISVFNIVGKALGDVNFAKDLSDKDRAEALRILSSIFHRLLGIRKRGWPPVTCRSCHRQTTDPVCVHGEELTDYGTLTITAEWRCRECHGGLNA